MPKPSPKKPDIEFAPDAWGRFESLVKSAAKMGPHPHDGSRPNAKTAVKKHAAKFFDDAGDRPPPGLLIPGVFG